MDDQTRALFEELIRWLTELQAESSAVQELLMESNLVTEEHMLLRIEDAKTEALLKLRAEAVRRAFETILKTRPTQ